MSTVNRVIIVGNLGAKPEVRYTSNGQAVASMSVATSDKWTSKDGQQNERTTWHRVQVWGKQAETCAQHLDKGRSVYIEGSYESREYETNGGDKRTVYEVRADRVVFLGGRTTDHDRAPRVEQWTSSAPRSAAATQVQDSDASDDPIPF
jgi:single-strand DNA-binding protein